ncbi:MAG: hypothetical protein R6X02_32180 [Enhygromyxa sp.]
MSSTATEPAPEPAPNSSDPPVVVVCNHHFGPARAMYPDEILVPRGHTHVGYDHHERSIAAFEYRAADPDRVGDGPIEGVEVMTWLAYHHLRLSELELRAACALDRGTTGPLQLHRESSPVAEHLSSAMDVAAEGLTMIARMHGEDDWSRTARCQQLGESCAAWVEELSGTLACLEVMAAGRLGELARAREAAGLLRIDLSCTLRGLIELGQALDEANLHDEARAIFERAAAIPEQPKFPVACPVVTPRPSVVEFDCRDGSPCGDLDVLESWCSWRDFLRYRLIWSAYRTGEVDAAETIAALDALAVSIGVTDLSTSDRLLAAIEHDIVQLGGRAP